jgi:hypothetical protein
MRWKRSAATSKQDHGAVIRRVLRPRAVLCVQARAGTATRGVAAGRELGQSWRARRRAAGKGNRVGAGERDAWRSIQQEVERRRQHSGS